VGRNHGLERRMILLEELDGEEEEVLEVSSFGRIL